MVLTDRPPSSPIFCNSNALAYFERAHCNQEARKRKRLREALATIRPLEIGDGRHGGGATAVDGSNSYETGAVSWG